MKYLIPLTFLLSACLPEAKTEPTDFVDLSERSKPESFAESAWQEVVIGAPDVTEIARFWTEIGGFEIRETTEDGLLLSAPGVTGWGSISLVESEGAATRPFGSQAWDTGCYFSVMHRAKDLRSIVEDARALGWTPLTDDVVFLEFGPSQLHVIVLGHEATGVQVQLYERLTTALPEGFPDFERISAPFNIMQMVRDRDTAYSFFQQGLGFDTFYYGRPYLAQIEEDNPIGIPKALTDEITYSAAITYPRDGMEWGRMEMIAIADDPRLDGRDLSGRCGNPVGIREVVFQRAKATSTDLSDRESFRVESRNALSADITTTTPDGAIIRFKP